MNNHYIPQLLIKQFASYGSNGNKVNVCNIKEKNFLQKKIKNTFSSEDSFDPELEAAFASKVEGPFGDLLNNILLKKNTITISRKQNMIMRMFRLINILRSPINSFSWDEMMDIVKEHNHPEVKAIEFLIRHDPEFKNNFKKIDGSKDSYISNLKKIMEYDSIEDAEAELVDYNAFNPLSLAIQFVISETTAIWDCTDTGQQFILPKLQGISEMDQVGRLHKSIVIKNLIGKIEHSNGNDFLEGTLKSFFSAL